MRPSRVRWIVSALSVAVALMVTVQSAYAFQTVRVGQRGEVRGQVTDASTGLPLAGVRILLSGTNISATTGQDGTYRLRNVQDAEVTVRAIMIGYNSVRTTLTVVDGVGAADFELNRAVVNLDEIVVTATGEQRKRELANATTTITASQVTQEVAPVSMASLIQGRAAGVQILNSSGTVGTSSKIRIRGASSISLTNEPLLVVDGIRVENGSNSLGFGTGGQSVSRMNDFNPDDIESIEIVKGPSAAALYGTAASNGVIVITTKKGRIGAPQWTAYTEQGIVTENTDWPDNYRGLDAAGGACRLANVGAGTCTQASIRTANPLNSDITGPFKNGSRRQYGLQVQGGTDDAQYFVSGEWEQEAGIFGLPQRTTDSILAAGGTIPDYAANPSNLERASFRANVNTRLGENTNLRVSTGFVSSNLNLPQNDNNITGMLPSGLLGGTDSTQDGGWGFFTPEEIFYIEGVQEVDRFTGSTNLSWRPTTWLDGHLTGGLDFTQRRDVRFQATGTGVDFSTRRQGDRTSDQRSIYQYTADAGLTAQYNISGNVTGKTAWAIQYFRNNVEQIETQGQTLAPGSGSNKSASTQFIDEDFIESITLGTFVEQQVGIDDRLFLTGAIRADDNSAFGQDFNLTYYPKLGVSYLMIEQGFGILNDFRVRAAYGASGQQPGSNDATKFFVGTAVVDDNGEQVGVAISGAGNAALKPERSAEIEIGFDAGLADGRLGFEATYYRRTTTDALIQRELAPSIGLTRTVFDNIGETRNSGFEAMFDASIIEGDNFEWELTLSGSTNSNEIVELGEGVEPIIFGSQVHQEGLPLGAWKDETFTFTDANGDGIITTSEITFSDSTEFVGYPRPRYEVSLFNSFEIGQNIRISGLFDYRGGHKKYNLTEAFRCGFNICQGLNDPSQTLQQQANAQSRRGGPGTATGFLEPGWFVKFRELSLTLIAPQSWAQAVKMSRMNLVLTGRNLGTWTDYLGSDPEVQGQSSNFGGRDFLTQPQVRYFTARLNVTF